MVWEQENPEASGHLYIYVRTAAAFADVYIYSLRKDGAV